MEVLHLTDTILYMCKHCKKLFCVDNKHIYLCKENCYCGKCIDDQIMTDMKQFEMINVTSQNK